MVVYCRQTPSVIELRQGSRTLEKALDSLDSPRCPEQAPSVFLRLLERDIDPPPMRPIGTQPAHYQILN
jgi:hypothetical protein